MGHLKVGVVGGGACGLAFAKVLSSRGLQVKVFEEYWRCGGTWCVGKPESQLYDGLRTNLPKELMAFPDDPFPDSLPSFIWSKDMDHYLAKYAETHKLNDMILFNSKVSKVEPIDAKGSRWKIEWFVKDTTLKECEEFNAVVVANGHFNKPRIPPKLEKHLPFWKGQWLHSKHYRNPSDFAGKTVVIVGAKSSGTDIAKELDGVAKEVHVCDPSCPNQPYVSVDGKRISLRADGPQQYPVPGTSCVYWRPRLIGLDRGTKVVRFDGKGPNLEADTIIFCTGYQFDFEFLNHSMVEVVKGKRVRSVYNQCMHVDFPNFFFAGLNQPIVPFPFFEMQAEWASSLLVHPELVPPKNIRKSQVEKIDKLVASGELELQNVHALPDQWEYLLRLASEANLSNIETLQARFEKHRQMYHYIHKLRPSFPGAPDTYRNATLRSLL